MINLGIIGLGPAWESRYEPALEWLSGRAQVRAVYDAVSARAEQVAAAHGARPVLGIRALLTRDDVDAVMVLDRAWYAEIPLRFLAEIPKPAYVAFSCRDHLDVLRTLHAAAARAGLTVMPEFRHRHNPATMRLQELLATRLGRPRRVSLAMSLPDGEPAASAEALMQAFDWCRYVLRSAPLQVRAANGQPRSDTGAGCCVEILFPGLASEGEPTVAQVELRGGALTSDRRRPTGAERGQLWLQVDADSLADRQIGSAGRANAACSPELERTGASCVEVLRGRVECAAGTAVLEAPDRITWTIGEESKCEQLTAERPAEVVMLDHFCRRVVGGLIPVSDVSDVCRSIEWTRAAQRSLQTRCPIPLHGRCEDAGDFRGPGEDDHQAPPPGGAHPARPQAP